MDNQLHTNILKLKKDLDDILKENDNSKLEKYNQLIKILVDDSNKRISMLEDFKSELIKLFEKSGNIKLMAISSKQTIKNKLNATTIIIISNTDIRLNATYKARKKIYKGQCTPSTHGKMQYQVSISNIPENDFVNVSENTYHVIFNTDANYKLLVEFKDDNITVEGTILCQKR